MVSDNILGVDSPRQGKFHLEVAVTDLDPHGNNRRAAEECIEPGWVYA
jgi:hypothetical protein